MKIGDMLFWPYDLAWSVQALLKVFVLVLVILMVVDAFNRKFREPVEKYIWLVLMLVTTWVGAIFYYIFVLKLNPKGIAKV